MEKSMAIKKVFLHFGMAKAGSSSIQQTLFNNNEVLKKNGFKYLTEWELNHLIKFKNLFSPCPVSPTGTEHLGRPPINKTQKNLESIDILLKVLKTSECEALILSGEYSAELWLDSTIENIKQFIKKHFENNGIEANIVYIVRNPLTWLTSWMQQRLRKDGFMNKNGDFFEIEMKQYDGLINLHKHFSNSLKIIQFEHACHDVDGLVGCFLKTIGFPARDLGHVTMCRTNESRCMEAMEFTYYVETIEPRHPRHNYRIENPNRHVKDLIYLKHIKGVKFDLPHQSKIEFLDRFGNTIQALKTQTGIDYTGDTIPPASAQNMYSEETIQGFLDAFPKLNFVLQRHFLKFFEKKYMETAQAKFKQLHDKGSIPWEIYHGRNVFLCTFRLRVRNKLRKAKRAAGERLPRAVKAPLKLLLRYKHQQG